MSEYNVRHISEQYNFDIYGVSYIGNPKMNTAMYVTNKEAHLVKNLEGFQYCLVFAEEGIEAPDELKKQNCFVFCLNPQLSYARFVNDFAEERRNIDSKRKYKLTDGGILFGGKCENWF